MFTLILLHLFTNGIALNWDRDFTTNQTYYHDDYYGEGTYGSSLALCAAVVGLYKCDKIRRFNRMKYLHRLLVGQTLFSDSSPTYILFNRLGIWISYFDMLCSDMVYNKFSLFHNSYSRNTN